MKRTQVVDRQFRALVSAACSGSFREYTNALKQLSTVDRHKTVDDQQLIALQILALIRDGKTDEGKEIFQLLLQSNPELVKTFVIPKLENASENNSDDFRAFVKSLGSMKLAPSKSSRIKITLLPASILLGLLIVSGAIWYRVNSNSETNLELNTQKTTSSRTMMETARQAVPLVVSRAKIIREDGTHFWKGLGYGSGFLVSESGVLITAAHVVKITDDELAYIRGEAAQNGCTVSDLDIALVFDVGGENRVIEGLHAQTSQDIDLAWIETKELSPIYLSFDKMPFETDDVFALGYPGSSVQLTEELNESDTIEREEAIKTIWNIDTGQTWLDLLGIQNFELEIRAGSVNAITDTENGILIHHQVRTSGGNSGGPLVNKDGGVVGIIILGHRLEDSTQRALSSLSIYHELQHHKELEWLDYE